MSRFFRSPLVFGTGFFLLVAAGCVGDNFAAALLLGGIGTALLLPTILHHLRSERRAEAAERRRQRRLRSQADWTHKGMPSL